MSKAPKEQAPQETGTPWRRYLWIGVPILVVVAVAVLLLAPRIEIDLAINGLVATDSDRRDAHLKTLKEHSDKELVIECLLDAVEDEDKEFFVRRMCCDLLINHFNRLTRLNGLLLRGTLHTRGVILRSLVRKDYFVDEYATDPAYRVEATIRAWLANDGDLTRTHAIQLAVRLELEDTMPLIRPLIQRSSTPSPRPTEERDLIIAAGGAVERFVDCGTVPALLEIAHKDPDDLVRLRFMQFVDRLVFRERPVAACKGAVDEARMKELVLKALDDARHTVRMGALLILARRVDWSKDAAGRMQEILDSNLTGAERRQALESLVSLGDPAFLDRFPRYFMDPAPEVRRTAGRAVSQIKDMRFHECLVGMLTAETENQVVWRDTLTQLHNAARRWIGFPGMLQFKRAKDELGFEKDMAVLFAGKDVVVKRPDGGLDVVKRAELEEAWFRWSCKELNLEEDQIEKAVAARQKFWDARGRRDVAAARAALEEAGFNTPGLFPYERAWIVKNEGG